MLNIGTKAPHFTVDTVSSFSTLPISVTLNTYEGKWLVLVQWIGM
ncbi:hypothetical protein [Bacillus sp. CGMCC 1.16541]|nr:hypothetical protein [Bacillus sp. CGMCC 1.16541]